MELPGDRRLTAEEEEELRRQLKANPDAGKLVLVGSDCGWHRHLNLWLSGFACGLAAGAIGTLAGLGLIRW